MKLGPYLLINVLLVGGGIFIYDSLKGDSPAPVSDSSDFGHLPPAPSGSDDPVPAPAPIMLDGGGNEMLLKDNARRINALESALSSLRREVARGGGSGSVGGSGATMPRFADSDVVEDENPVFDDNTVATIAAYMDEINRRKNEERQKTRITTELERKGIELTESQRASIVSETLAYQTRARELLRKQFSRDEAGRTERKQAFESLQEDFAVTVKSLVPETQAEKILESRLGRGMGFFGNMAGGGGAGRLRRGGKGNR